MIVILYWGLYICLWKGDDLWWNNQDLGPWSKIEGDLSVDWFSH